MKTSSATIIKVASVTVLTGTVFLTSVDFKNINLIIASTKNNVDSSSSFKTNQFPTIAQKIKNTSVLFVEPKIQISFAGQPAQAQRAKVVQQVWVQGKKFFVWGERILTVKGLIDLVGDSFKFKRTYFIVSNELQMEWGEAWHYCNKYPNSKLIWANNLKMCVPAN